MSSTAGPAATDAGDTVIVTVKDSGDVAVESVPDDKVSAEKAAAAAADHTDVAADTPSTPDKKTDVTVTSAAADSTSAATPLKSPASEKKKTPKDKKKDTPNKQQQPGKKKTPAKSDTRSESGSEGVNGEAAGAKAGDRQVDDSGSKAETVTDEASAAPTAVAGDSSSEQPVAGDKPQKSPREKRQRNRNKRDNPKNKSAAAKSGDSTGQDPETVSTETGASHEADAAADSTGPATDGEEKAATIDPDGKPQRQRRDRGNGRGRGRGGPGGGFRRGRGAYTNAGLTSPPYKYNFSVKKEGDAAGGEENADGSGPDADAVRGDGDEGKVRQPQQRRQRRQPRDRPGFFAPRVFSSPRKNRNKSERSADGQDETAAVAADGEAADHPPHETAGSGSGEAENQVTSTKPKRKNRKPRRRRSKSKSDGGQETSANGHPANPDDSPHDAPDEYAANRETHSGNRDGQQQPRIRRGGYRSGPRAPFQNNFNKQGGGGGGGGGSYYRDNRRPRPGSDSQPLSGENPLPRPAYNYNPRPFYGNNSNNNSGSYERRDNHVPGGFRGRGGYRGGRGFNSNYNNSGSSGGNRFDGDNDRRTGGSFRGGYSNQRRERQQAGTGGGGGYPGRSFHSDYPPDSDPIPVQHESSSHGGIGGGASIW